MHFESAAPSVIKSIRQRDLLNTWLRLYARSGRRPVQSDYHPNRFDEELRDVVYYVVDPCSVPARIVINSNGSRLSHAYGHSGKDNKGMSLIEYLPPELRETVMLAYYTCVERGLPVYTIAMIDDINGRAVAYERLLLPFYVGNTVSHIIASLKTISEDGGFEIKDLLRAPERLPVSKLRVVIDCDLIVRTPSRTHADDIVEI